MASPECIEYAPHKFLGFISVLDLIVSLSLVTDRSIVTILPVLDKSDVGGGTISLMISLPDPYVNPESAALLNSYELSVNPDG